MKKMLFDFIVKKYVELITNTSLLKRMYLLNFENFSVENLETTLSTFRSFF